MSQPISYCNFFMKKHQRECGRPCKVHANRCHYHHEEYLLKQRLTRHNKYLAKKKSMITTPTTSASATSASATPLSAKYSFSFSQSPVSAKSVPVKSVPVKSVTELAVMPAKSVDKRTHEIKKPIESAPTKSVPPPKPATVPEKLVAEKLINPFLIAVTKKKEIIMSDAKKILLSFSKGKLLTETR